MSVSVFGVAAVVVGDGVVDAARVVGSGGMSQEDAVRHLVRYASVPFDESQACDVVGWWQRRGGSVWMDADAGVWVHESGGGRVVRSRVDGVGRSVETVLVAQCRDPRLVRRSSSFELFGDLVDEVRVAADRGAGFGEDSSRVWREALVGSVFELMVRRVDGVAVSVTLVEQQVVVGARMVGGRVCLRRVTRQGRVQTVKLSRDGVALWVARVWQSRSRGARVVSGLAEVPVEDRVMRVDDAGRHVAGDEDVMRFARDGLWSRPSRSLSWLAGVVFGDRLVSRGRVVPFEDRFQVSRFADAEFRRRFWLQDTARGLTVSLFGVSRFRKSLVRAVAGADPVALYVAWTVRDLVDVDWLVDMLRGCPDGVSGVVGGEVHDRVWRVLRAAGLGRGENGFVARNRAVADVPVWRMWRVGLRGLDARAWRRLVRQVPGMLGDDPVGFVSLWDDLLSGLYQVEGVRRDDRSVGLLEAAGLADGWDRVGRVDGWSDWHDRVWAGLRTVDGVVAAERERVRRARVVELERRERERRAALTPEQRAAEDAAEVERLAARAEQERLADEVAVLRPGCARLVRDGLDGVRVVDADGGVWGLRVAPADVSAGSVLRGWAEVLHNCMGGYACRVEQGSTVVGVVTDERGVVVAGFEVGLRDVSADGVARVDAVLSQLLGQFNDRGSVDPLVGFPVVARRAVVDVISGVGVDVSGSWWGKHLVG